MPGARIDKKVVRLSPLHAVVFACIFQSEEKSGPAMLEFLNAVLKHVGEEPITEIISMKSEYPVFGMSADVKYGRLDVRVKAESGRLFDIEVQIDKDFMNERGFFYGGRLGEDEFKSGMSYDQIPEVRVINLVDFYVRGASADNDTGSTRNLAEDEKACAVNQDKKAQEPSIVEPVVLAYQNHPGEIATNKFKMYHIQLPAFRKKYKTLESVKGDSLFSWLYMFDRGYQNPEEMEALSDMSEGLRNFAMQYNYAINDPELIRRYRMIEDGKHDIASKMVVAERKGRYDEKRDNARRMKARGFSVDDIIDITGLTAIEVNAL